MLLLLHALLLPHPHQLWRPELPGYHVLLHQLLLPCLHQLLLLVSLPLLSGHMAMHGWHAQHARRKPPVIKPEPRQEACGEAHDRPSRLPPAFFLQVVWGSEPKTCSHERSAAAAGGAACTGGLAAAGDT